MNLGLSGSEYCTGIHCKTKLWLESYRKDLFDENCVNRSSAESAIVVGKYARNLFGDHTEIPFSEDASRMVSMTRELLDGGEKVIAEASFEYDGNFCSVDILRNSGNGEVFVYEVKSAGEVKDSYLDAIAYKYYVLTKNNLRVRQACLVTLNTKYVRHGELKLDELFTVKDVTETVRTKAGDVEANIAEMKSVLRNPEPECILKGDCRKSKDRCGFFAYCIRKFVPENTGTLFDVSGIRDKDKLLEQRLYTFEDLYRAGVLKDNQLRQVETELKNLPPVIEKNEIKKFLGTLSYPLYFLDFESFNPPVPLYEGSRPYEQIVFQYSLHYLESKDSKLSHAEFLALPGKDPRREVAENLCRHIPKDVCVTAYNMKFEKMIISGLANLYPDLKDHLMNIHSNIRDLMFPFEKKFYYTKEMEGSHSIKHVLPALYPDDPSLDYHNLEGVHNGGEASNAFLGMQSMEEDELGLWRTRLLRYCGLDTYAMVKVYEKLCEAVQ